MSSIYAGENRAQEKYRAAEVPEDLTLKVRPPEKSRSVPNAMRTLEVELDKLEAVASALAARLDPIVAPVPTTDPKFSETDPSNCAMVDSIHDLTRRATRVSMQLGYLVENIQI